MTFEKVLEVFADHLRKDADCEVIQTRHGYTVLIWDKKAQTWDTCEYCATPQDLYDQLVGAYADFAELQFTKGERELTESEQLKIMEECDRLRKLAC